MGRFGKLDAIDRKIMSIIYKNPEITQMKLAERVGLTQAAISTRLSRLREMGMISKGCMIINPSNLGLELMSIDAYTEHADAVVEKFKHCPCAVSIFGFADESNRVEMIMVGEDKQLEYCITKHIRRAANITSIVARRITNMQKGIGIITHETAMGDEEEDKKRMQYDLPCNDAPCSRCEYYVDNGGACYGCPFTAFYRGRFWNNGNGDE
ncbi:MAG: winged helix-turn-helix transcriptional regulator [Candidatus Nitrosocaldus sp.]